MAFSPEKDLALCGLACVLCSNEGCPGCKARGCSQGEDCAVYRCALDKGLDGCYACRAFPCDQGMLKNPRIRAFNTYARQHGKQALLRRLQQNHEAGILYHRSQGIRGDYDNLASEGDILRLIAFGTPNPYSQCPQLESRHFILRLVRPEDAPDLLQCYADPKAQPLFNADNCTGDFRFQTLEDMRYCIRFWLLAYETQEYVRFAILDKASHKAVGTIEMFGMVGQYQTPQGVLRLDIASPYEKADYLLDLLVLCRRDLCLLFGAQEMITKAIPEAVERIAALHALGFVPCQRPQYKDGWVLAQDTAPTEMPEQ